jgi:hypothetical protein
MPSNAPRNIGAHATCRRSARPRRGLGVANCCVQFARVRVFGIVSDFSGIRFEPSVLWLDIDSKRAIEQCPCAPRSVTSEFAAGYGQSLDGVGLLIFFRHDGFDRGDGFGTIL